MYKLESVLENETHKILIVVKGQTVLINRKKEFTWN